MATVAAPIHRLSVEQVDALVEAGIIEDRRTELVDGILYDVVPPNPPHSYTVEFVARHLMRALPDELMVLTQDAIFIHGGYLSPDVFVAPRGMTRERHRSALLAIEVTHTTHARDRQKAEEYARAAVGEYWMVDLAARHVVVHQAPVDGSYTEVVTVSDGTLPLPVGALPLDVAALLAAGS